MIIPDSEKSESSRHSARSPSSLAASDAPPSPPPYSATIASGDDLYQSHGRAPSSGGFQVPSGSGSMPNPNAPPAPRPNLPPRCNHLVESKLNSAISGTWHVDTALQIPERLLPPITAFDGSWNKDIQRARKEREKEIKRRDSAWRSGPRTSPVPPVVEVRPNLMLSNTNGSIRSDVHVVSSDGVIRPTTIVAEGTNGSLALKIHAPPDQPLRVFASSTNGSVSVRVPSSFEGAVMMSTTWGSVKISDSIKAKLTPFSSTSNKTWCFVGDWQALGFGTSPDSSDPNDDPPLPTIQPVSLDPFASWNGPLVHISSTNGSISLGFTEEETPSEPGGLSRAFRNLMNSFFGGGGGNDGHDGSNGPPLNQPPPPAHNPSGPRCGTYPRDVKHPIPGGIDLD